MLLFVKSASIVGRFHVFLNFEVYHEIEIELWDQHLNFPIINLGNMEHLKSLLCQCIFKVKH